MKKAKGLVWVFMVCLLFVLSFGAYYYGYEKGRPGRLTEGEMQRIAEILAEMRGDPIEQFTATQIYDKVAPSTVRIEATLQDIPENYVEGYLMGKVGTGFFLTANGEIATNYHVIEKCWDGYVYTFSGNSYDIERVIAFNKYYDVAVIKINITGAKPVELEDDVTIGENVYALGNSLGAFTNSFSFGIVTHPERYIEIADFGTGQFYVYDTYDPTNADKIRIVIQTQTPISGGNSGGPLINRLGKVIGINAATVPDGQNINLSISIGMLDEIDRYATPKTLAQVAQLTGEAALKS